MPRAWGMPGPAALVLPLRVRKKNRVMKKNVLERIEVAVRHFRNHKRTVELADAHHLRCEVP